MAPPVFPALPGLTFPVKRSIKWRDTKQDALSGKRVRVSYQLYPTYMYEVTFNFLRTPAAYAEWQTLTGFINSTLGGSGLFLYFDPNDNQSAPTMHQIFGVGDGSTTIFRLVRTLGFFVEPVFFPFTPIPSVRVNGVATTNYSIDSTGNIVFNVPPPGGENVDWTGNFYWPCRFDTDPFEFENFASGFFEQKSLKFSTEKLD